MPRTERLLLIAAIGASTLALANSSLTTTRTAHADALTRVEPQDLPIAVCEIWNLAETMYNSDELADERKRRMDEQAQRTIEPLRARFEALDEASGGAGGGEGEDWQALYEEYDKATAAMYKLEAQLDLEDITRVYREVTQTAREIALELGYSYVLDASPFPEKVTNVEDFVSFWEAAKFASAPVFPEGVDITQDVADELNIDLDR